MFKITKDAQLSDCGKYRFALSRQWDEGKPVVLFVMLNPSTADAENDDPTIRRCTRFARDWGYGGFIVANLFAYRTPKPADLLKAHKEGVDIVHENTNEHIKILSKRAAIVVFAWGNGKLPIVQERAIEVAEMMKYRDCYCIETSGFGFPKHPLYLPADSTPKLIKLDAETLTFYVPEKSIEDVAATELAGQQS